MSTITSVKELTELFHAADYNEDFTVLDAKGNALVIFENEYGVLVAQDEDLDPKEVADTYTFYGPSIPGAWSVYGPFSTK